MSYEQVKEFFTNLGLSQRVVVRDSISNTVENAAIAIGCRPEEIAKTMSFFVDGMPVLIVMAGDAKIDNSKYKSYFRQKAKMIPFDCVEQFVGHAPGGVCPFATKDNVQKYLDVSLKRFKIIYAAAGSPNSTVTLSLEELECCSGNPTWIDVCKGWC